MMILIQAPIMPALALTTIDCLNADIDPLYTIGDLANRGFSLSEREWSNKFSG